MEVAVLVENEDMHPDAPIITEVFLYDTSLYNEDNPPSTTEDYIRLRTNSFYLSRPLTAGSFAQIQIEKIKFKYQYSFNAETYINYTASVSRADLTNTFSGQIRTRIVYPLMEEQIKTETWSYDIFTALSAIGGAMGLISSFYSVISFLYDKKYPPSPPDAQIANEWATTVQVTKEGQ